MNTIIEIQKAFEAFLQTHFSFPPTLINTCTLTINSDEKKQAFGDLSSNAALILAKHANQQPRALALSLVEQFTHPAIEKSEIAGPGFINFYLTDAAFKELARTLFIQKRNFYTQIPQLERQRYCIEFVSANPTGPLHFGHGRGGIIGDVLGNILSFLGHEVVKEFYINDAGSQIGKLGRSFKIRCQQAVGHDALLPEDGYHGTYLATLADEFMATQSPEILNKPDEFFADYAKEQLLEQIKHTLQAYGINFDVWFSEKTLHDSGAIAQAVDILCQKGHCTAKDDALWFKSTEFGDDKDRVIRKSDGSWTYVAADIAYLRNKAERGYNKLIMILGHDHHSFAVRLHALVQALGLKEVTLEVILYQLVKMKEGGQLLQMSKRTGTMITLSDVINTVGTDVARFFYLHRKTDAQLDFDLDLALKKTDENPVYYVQYAYVRIKSILEKAAQEIDYVPSNEDDTQFVSATDHLLLKKMASLKELLETISHNYQTHLLSYYAIELADAFHRYYSMHRVIDTQNPEQTKGRLALMTMLKDSFELALTLMGISCPEKM